MRAIEFIYQENEIHFLVNPTDQNVMVNATEMAKLFGKDVREFLKLEGTKKYINSKLKSLNNDGNSPQYTERDLIVTNKKAGTLMSRPVALKFAAWLDTDFEVWVFDIIDNIVFGHYKEHWEAHARQEEAKIKMKRLRREIIQNPTKDSVISYFEAERVFNQSKKDKTRAIRTQLRLFQD